MRLTRKLTLALMLGITLVMAANALLQVRRENALFDIDSRRDQQAVGSVLHTAVEHIWLAAGEGAAQQLIQEASQDQPRSHDALGLARARGAPRGRRAAGIPAEQLGP